MDLYMMNCELLATCSALGFLEGDVYHKEPDCLGNALTFNPNYFTAGISGKCLMHFVFCVKCILSVINKNDLVTFMVVNYLFVIESVKDLIRYLRHEDDTRDIRQQLGAGQILQNDLLPIITQHTQDKPLFDACIRCLAYYFFYFLMKSIKWLQ